MLRAPIKPLRIHCSHEQTRGRYLRCHIFLYYTSPASSFLITTLHIHKSCIALLRAYVRVAVPPQHLTLVTHYLSSPPELIPMSDEFHVGAT